MGKPFDKRIVASAGIQPESFAQRAPQEIGKVRTMILGTPAEGYIGCASAVRNMSQTGLLRDIHPPHEHHRRVCAGRSLPRRGYPR
jgi:hypothetical protein